MNGLMNSVKAVVLNVSIGRNNLEKKPLREEFIMSACQYFMSLGMTFTIKCKKSYLVTMKVRTIITTELIIEDRNAFHLLVTRK